MTDQVKVIPEKEEEEEEEETGTAAAVAAVLVTPRRIPRTVSEHRSEGHLLYRYTEEDMLKVNEKILTLPKGKVIMECKPHHTTEPTVDIRMSFPLWKTMMIWAHYNIQEWYTHYIHVMSGKRLGSMYGSTAQQQAVMTALSLVLKRDVTTNEIHDIVKLISTYYRSLNP